MSRKPFLVLALAVLGISFAGPLVRLSAADPVAIAVWRLGFSLLIVGAFLVATRQWREWRRIDFGDFLLAIGGGVALAVHFWAWDASIRLTTIAAWLSIVNLQPARVSCISASAVRRIPMRSQFVGI